jgi:hypothetical protein
MDTTDIAVVRAVVLALAVGCGIVWAGVWCKAPKIRPGRSGILLRYRAIVFLCYALNVGLMSLAILIPHWLVSERIYALWRMVTRMHASVAILIVGLDVLLAEGRDRE